VQIHFESSDRVAGSHPVAMTRAAWAAYPGTVLAGAVELSYTGEWGQVYRAPVGEDHIGDFGMFGYSAVLVMAAGDDTGVAVDGVLGPPLNTGEGLLVEVDEGAQIVASPPRPRQST
jgi:hypothetical protein